MKQDDVELVVTTANLKNSLGWDEFLEDLRGALQGSDVVALQEVQDRNLPRALRDLEQEDAWLVVHDPRGGSRGRQAFLLRRKRFRRTSLQWAVDLLHKSRMFPSATRHLLKARVRDRETRRLIRLANVHLVPHADGGKRDPRGRVTNKPRRDLVVTSLKHLARWFRRAGSAAVSIAVGDFNVDLDADLQTRDPMAPVETMARAGAVNTLAALGRTRVNTHGRNMFDQAYVKARPRVARIISHRVMPKRYSDHRAYRFTIRASVR